MNKPNIDIPSGFAENGTKEDFPNDKILNGFDPINPDILPGDCLNKFIDDTYKGLNYALDLGDYVLGKDQITNYILEAPNGIMDINGNTITVKNGLKVIFGNGVEYTVPNDISYTPSYDYGLQSLVFLRSDGAIIHGRQDFWYFSNTQWDIPAREYHHLYSSIDKKYYWCPQNSTNWVEETAFSYCPIGYIRLDNNGNLIDARDFDVLPSLINNDNLYYSNILAIRDMHIVNYAGWIELKNGLCLQWGTKAISAGDNIPYNIVMHKQFRDTDYVVWFNPNITIHITGLWKDTYQFGGYLYERTAGGQASGTAIWYALGRVF